MPRKGEKLFGSELFDRSRNGPIPVDLTQMSSGLNNYVRECVSLRQTLIKERMRGVYKY